MDNKYSLGGSKVSSEKLSQEHTQDNVIQCIHCQSTRLIYDTRKQDYRCEGCGEWQGKANLGYSTGRSADY